MASIEITLPMVALSVGWLTSTLGLSWMLSRRSKAWDESERHQKILFGDPDKREKGLVHRVQELEDERIDDEAKQAIMQRLKSLEDVSEATAKRMKMLQRALNAHGSDEHFVSEAVRRHIAEEAIRAQQEASEARKKILAEQEQRFTREEPDPFRHHGRTETPKLPMSRVEQPIPRTDPTWVPPPPGKKR